MGIGHLHEKKWWSFLKRRKMKKIKHGKMGKELKKKKGAIGVFQ